MLDYCGLFGQIIDRIVRWLVHQTGPDISETVNLNWVNSSHSSCCSYCSYCSHTSHFLLFVLFPLFPLPAVPTFPTLPTLPAVHPVFTVPNLPTVSVLHTVPTVYTLFQLFWLLIPVLLFLLFLLFLCFLPKRNSIICARAVVLVFFLVFFLRLPAAGKLECSENGFQPPQKMKWIAEKSARRSQNRAKTTKSAPPVHLAVRHTTGPPIRRSIYLIEW